jgi:hypothetical protein
MSRWPVVVSLVLLAIPACKVKKREQPAVTEMAPIKPPGVEPEQAVKPEMPAIANSSLPASCQHYREAIQRMQNCTEYPAAARRALRDAFAQMESGWKDLAPEATQALDHACSEAADAVEQSLSATCGQASATGTGSRTVPGERGVPLDQTALGSLPHPFGALEVLKPGMARDEILSALPNARRDGDDKVVVPLGVEDLMADIDIDYTGHLDVVRIKLSDPAKAVLTKAWGKPTSTGAWFDRKRRWRADLDETNELMIGTFTPLAELLGKGPDGLAETKALVGATPAELTARFGDRIHEVDVENDSGDATGEKRYELLVPATDVCKFYTHVEARLTAGRVAKVLVAQCYDDEAQRRAALAAMEGRWGKAVPGRSAEDRPVFTFVLPGRKAEMTIDENDAEHPGWQIVLGAK